MLVAAICAVAVIDHTHKHDRRIAAQRDAWFCRHRGTHCGGANASAIEASWNRRERGYAVLAGVLGVVAIVSTGAALRTRPRTII